MYSSRTPICHMKTSLHLIPLTLSSFVLGYGTMANPLKLNVMSTHSLEHQSSGLGFATSLSGKPKKHGKGRGMEKAHFQLGEDEILFSSSLPKSLSKLERKYLKKVQFYCENYYNVWRGYSSLPSDSVTRPSFLSSPFRACL
ncbi:hypothetical protein H5410_002676 [Solanum commersonii]|uniref:Uncharacterized protein n=1 Tax=Solanum commersonii TaxID=4109 RepID=A0A9J6B3J2_SOLCO|nr:hypothetical protein H5410_002676 [Solanum commersonii]